MHTNLDQYTHLLSCYIHNSDVVASVYRLGWYIHPGQLELLQSGVQWSAVNSSAVANQRLKCRYVLVDQCFSTGVPRNLMVSRAMASKHSAESNR